MASLKRLNMTEKASFGQYLYTIQIELDSACGMDIIDSSWLAANFYIPLSEDSRHLLDTRY
jgi:hypothetical protein